MSDDPRWHDVRAFLHWFEANRLEPDPEEFLGRMRSYHAALEGIAVDTALPPDEREAAQEILERHVCTCTDTYW